MARGRKKSGEVILTKCTSILRDCEDKYNGAGIYRLYDNYGKSYIGRSIHIQNRLRWHRYKLNDVFFNDTPYGDNVKLDEAVQKGLTFNAEILEKVPPEEVNFWNMRRKEEKWVELYGGVENTYNVRIVV
jgi:hypothetical protein